MQPLLDFQFDLQTTNYFCSLWLDSFKNVQDIIVILYKNKKM